MRSKPLVDFLLESFDRKYQFPCCVFVIFEYALRIVEQQLFAVEPVSFSFKKVLHELLTHTIKRVMEVKLGEADELLQQQLSIMLNLKKSKLLIKNRNCRAFSFFHLFYSSLKITSSINIDLIKPSLQFVLEYF